jgi:hypothetical protein
MNFKKMIDQAVVQVNEIVLFNERGQWNVFFAPRRSSE